METLKIENLNDIPFPEYVKKLIGEGLKPLTDSGDLKIDFTGKEKDTKYALSFELEPYGWNSYNRTHCWYHPFALGMAPFVNVDALKKLNHCDNVKKCSTCEPVFRHTKEELGKMLGYTALHEIGHVFGLLDKSSFAGANDEGHSPDPKNYMFAITSYPGYLRRPIDPKTTMKYIIQKGDTLSEIAARKGMKWKDLYEFKGQDGRKNREILRSGDPHLIYPGEEIWVPDDKARLKFKRDLWLMDESFTKTQIDSMRRWIKTGRTMYDAR